MKIVCSLEYELWLYPYQHYVCYILNKLHELGHTVYVNATKLHPHIEKELSKFKRYEKHIHVDIHLNASSSIKAFRHVKADKHVMWILNNKSYFQAINNVNYVNKHYDTVIIPFRDENRFEMQKTLLIGISKDLPLHEFVGNNRIGMLSYDIKQMKINPKQLTTLYDFYAFGDRALPISYDVTQLYSIDITFLSELIDFWCSFNDDIVDFGLIEAMACGLCCIVKPTPFNAYLLSNHNCIQYLDLQELRIRLSVNYPLDVIREFGQRAQNDIRLIHPSVEEYIKELVS